MKLIYKNGFCLTFTLVACLFSNNQSFAQNQNLLELKSGKISFMSYAPMEVITASSDKMRGLINPALNTFAVNVLNSSFLGFNSDLQREHFNERFIESASYEYCSYAGKFIEKIDWSKDGNYKVRVKGKLIIHGVVRERVINVAIQIQSGNVQGTAKFSVFLADHEITIPAIVNQKISDEIEVYVNATFSKR